MKTAKKIVAEAGKLYTTVEMQKLGLRPITK